MVLLSDHTYVVNHFKETKDLVKDIPSKDIANWILNHGYFPEQYILPPSFQVSNFTLQTEPCKKLNKLKRQKLVKISHPKTNFSSRIFGIQHPHYYHDIVFYLEKNWNDIIEHLFNEKNKIYSYSFPIALTKKSRSKPELSNLRTGRMIYEWLAMAERDLVLDASHYQFIARTDISNFYPSIYTHSIAWALHGREEALKDSNYFGNKIDKLIQYANDGRTNGIPIGSVLSDLIAEIILAKIDTNTSEELKDIKFLAVRFKDDYRLLCNSEADARKILKTLGKNLSTYNLSINESKTSIQKLPDGLYRKHDREYFPHSLKNRKGITFKCFEHTLLIALDIHRKYPGTSILEKFISECFVKSKSKKQKDLKIVFSQNKQRRLREIKQVISLLFLVKRESEKLLCHVLSICERLYLEYNKDNNELKPYIKSTIENEVSRASNKGSVFEIIWLIFFSRYLGLGINKERINELVQDLDADLKKNQFYKSILESKQEIFRELEKGIELFKAPTHFKNNTEFILSKYLDIFDREEID
jgi:hypothetical protein